MGTGPLGVDCVGLVVYAVKRVGIVSFDFELEPYELEPDFKTMFYHLRRIAKRSMVVEPGGLVLFLRNDLIHIAITSEHNHIVHADSAHGFVSEIPFTEPWVSRPHSFWELK